MNWIEGIVLNKYNTDDLEKLYQYIVKHSPKHKLDDGKEYYVIILPKLMIDMFINVLFNSKDSKENTKPSDVLPPPGAVGLYKDLAIFSNKITRIQLKEFDVEEDNV